MTWAGEVFAGVTPFWTRRRGVGGGGGGDPLWSDVQFLVQGDEPDGTKTAMDLSDDARTLLLNGNTTGESTVWRGAESDPPKTEVFGNNIIRAGGLNSWVGISDTADANGLDMSGAFTVEEMVLFSDIDASLRDIMVKMGGSSTRTIRVFTDPTVRWYVSADGSNQIGGSATDTGFTPPTDEFGHLAFCRDGDDDVRLFWNGTQIGTTVNKAGALYKSNQDFRYASTHLGAETPNMSLNAMRFTRAARYTADFDPPTALWPTSA